MINNLALKFSQYFIKNKDVKYDDIEIYHYGFFVLFTKIYFAIFTIVWGIIFGVFVESVVFYFAFSMIRQFAGGYHATTEIKCEIITSISIIFSLVIIKIFTTYNLSLVLLIVALISAFAILLLSPLGTQEKPLNKKEYNYFRKISLIILLIIFLVVVVSFVYDARMLFVPSCVCLILEGLLLIMGKIKDVMLNSK